MSTDYAEKEREFLNSLKADTGRDLGEWMRLIAEQNLTHRNEIIDWLRQQGFMFSKASWLERIYHNGGRPIYADRPQPRPSAPRQAREGPAPFPADTMAQTSPTHTDQPLASQVEPRAGLAPPPADPLAHLDQLLAKAKAYRPLARLVLREIARVVPAASLTGTASHVSISHGREFAILTIGPRELRLGLDLGARPFDETLRPAKFTNPASRISPAITHMTVLTDARQVTPAILAAIEEAAGRLD